MIKKERILLFSSNGGSSIQVADGCIQPPRWLLSISWDRDSFGGLEAMNAHQKQSRRLFSAFEWFIRGW